MQPQLKEIVHDYSETKSVKDGRIYLFVDLLRCYKRLILIKMSSGFSRLFESNHQKQQNSKNVIPFASSP
jgi:hypothetical protein